MTKPIEDWSSDDIESLTNDDFGKMNPGDIARVLKRYNDLHKPQSVEREEYTTTAEEDMIDRLGYENCVNDESWNEGL